MKCILKSICPIVSATLVVLGCGGSENIVPAPAAEEARILEDCSLPTEILTLTSGWTLQIFSFNNEYYVTGLIDREVGVSLGYFHIESLEEVEGNKVMRLLSERGRAVLAGNRYYIGGFGVGVGIALESYDANNYEIERTPSPDGIGFYGPAEIVAVDSTVFFTGYWESLVAETEQGHGIWSYNIDSGLFQNHPVTSDHSTLAFAEDLWPINNGVVFSSQDDAGDTGLYIVSDANPIPVQIADAEYLRDVAVSSGKVYFADQIDDNTVSIFEYDPQTSISKPILRQNQAPYVFASDVQTAFRFNSSNMFTAEVFERSGILRLNQVNPGSGEKNSVDMQVAGDISLHDYGLIGNKAVFLLDQFLNDEAPSRLPHLVVMDIATNQYQQVALPVSESVLLGDFQIIGNKAYFEIRTPTTRGNLWAIDLGCGAAAG